MKVLISIFEQLYPISGGGTPRISNLVRAFAHRGHEVLVVAGFGASSEESCRELGCREAVVLKTVSRLDPAKMKKYLFAHPVNILRLAWAVRRFKPDLVVSHNTIAGAGALLGSAMIRRRPLLVLDLTDVLFEYLSDYGKQGWLSMVHKLGRKMEEAAIRRSDRIVTISAAMKKILLDYGADEGKIDVVCDGVDLSVFQRVEESKLRGRLAPGRDTLIAYQGVIDPQDEPGLVVEAARLVVARHPSTVFLVIGGGTALPGLRGEVAAAGLEDNFYFSGWVTQAEVARYLSAADIGLVVLPDTVSARGRVTLKEFEYWACGEAVIAPRLPALEEVIEDGVNGIFYRPSDAADLADRINLLIADPALRRRLAEAGRLLVEAKYRWEKLADDFVAVCENIYSSRPSRR